MGKQTYQFLSDRNHFDYNLSVDCVNYFENDAW